MVREAPPGGDGAQKSSSGTDIFYESQFLTSTASKRVHVHVGSTKFTKKTKKKQGSGHCIVLPDILKG